MEDLTNESVEELRRKAAALTTEVGRLTVERNEQKLEIENLKAQLDALLQRLYGRKSERFTSWKGPDFLDLMGYEDPKPEEAPPEETEKVEYTRKRPRPRGPKPLPDHLERIVVEVDPEDEARQCSCCSKPMERTGEIVTEELDIVPAKFRVKRFVQGKYSCPSCMNRSLVKPLPERPIQKGRPSPTLLAYLIVAKYVDHLPLHRQEQIFRRSGVELPRSTMDEWLGQLADLLLPIVECMKRRFLALGYLQVDETPVDAIDRREKKKKGKGKQIQRCYIWSYARPWAEVIYEVTEGRSGRAAQEFLEGFRGYVQTDGYVGYDALFKSGERQRVACMAHIRRKFYEARGSLPQEVEKILEQIKALYAIEADCRSRELDSAGRLEMRKTRSRPVFDQLKTKIDDLADLPTPQSPLGKAIRYATGQWDAMSRYLEDGELELDNNSCEHTMRSPVLGRKNYLFLGSVEGGARRVKAFYSLTQSAKRIGLDPFQYLADVIERVASHPITRIDELTPLGWKLARERAGELVAPAAR